MSRQQSTYAAPMSPVTPIWAGNPNFSAAQRQQLLPSAIEMNTPPQTVPRKHSVTQSSHLSTVLSFPEAIHLTNFSGQPGLAANSNMAPSGNDVSPDAGHFRNMESNNVSTYTTMNSQSAPPQAMVSSQAFHISQYALPGQRHNAVSSQVASESYPSMQASYQQYYPQSANRRVYLGTSSWASYHPGRVVKGSSRLAQDSQLPAHLFPHQNTHTLHAKSSQSFLPNGLNTTGDMQQRYPMVMGPNLPQKMVTMRQKISQNMHQGMQQAVSGYSDSRAARVPQCIDSLVNGGNSNGKDKYAAYNHYILRHAAEEKSKVIWPPEVEAAFMEAVWLIPGDSCKIQMERRTRGRNELISDYLKHQLNEIRSRKQVSSHLQVLKKLLRDDEEFLECVGPRKSESQLRIYGEKQEHSKPRPDMAASTLTQLISKLKAAKQGHRKPAFLLQAEFNLQQSRLEDSNRMEITMGRRLSANCGGDNAQTPSHHTEIFPNMKSESQVSPSAQLVQTDVAANSPSHVTTTAPSMAENNETSRRIHIGHVTKEPPLIHPRPVHAQDMNTFAFDPVVPSASVPPSEALMVKSSPGNPLRHHRRHPSRHHHRTTSTSVDLSGDRVLPIQFTMKRVQGNEYVIYSRLLRATYESPMRPLQLHNLTPKFAELSKQASKNLLAGTQVVHANVALHIRPNPELNTQTIREQYSSDVQFVVTADAANSQHRYIAKTVVASRATELLRCEMPCMYQRLAGRGLELDKELVNVPFLPDFWSDFLARLNNSAQEDVEAALTALTLQQSIYRVTNNIEELYFVGLYQFSVAQDEFSARTRFRRVKGVSSALSQQGLQRNPVPSDNSQSASTSQSAPATREPSTPIRTENSSQRALEQTPKFSNTPSLLGMGTPGQAVGPLGALMNCDSPCVFASPRRMANLDILDLGASPFASAAGNETRHSPRSNKFEIQRAMTAFEPSAWDEMHDWIYQ